MTPPKIKEISETSPPRNMEYEARDGKLYARRIGPVKERVCVYQPRAHPIHQSDGYCYECGAYTGW